MRTTVADCLLPAAWEAAREAGVTRLANITLLDRIGLPVWQAVRPMSRALTVHQGKGMSNTDAQLGALMEAIESHSAETYVGAGPVCSFDALPRECRAPTLADFAANREHPPPSERAIRWVEAEGLSGRGSLFIPWDVVSLDFTTHVPSLFDRASNGVAAGATFEEAIRVAIHELIERDAVTEWKAAGFLSCMKGTVDLRTVPFRWLHYWQDRIEAAGAYLKLYHVPSVTGTPVFACEISDLNKDGAPYRSIQGRGCHPSPELALFKALAEAVQGRVTYIAGARDDLLPADYLPTRSVLVAFALPLPPDMTGVDFNRIPPGPTSLEALVEALDGSGYGSIAVIPLAQLNGISVVRAFVCGLGSPARRRRPLP